MMRRRKGRRVIRHFLCANAIDANGAALPTNFDEKNLAPIGERRIQVRPTIPMPRMVTPTGGVTIVLKPAFLLSF